MHDEAMRIRAEPCREERFEVFLYDSPVIAVRFVAV